MSLEDGTPEPGGGTPEPGGGMPEPGAPAAPAKPKRKHPRWLIILELLTVFAVVAPFVAYLIATNIGSSSTAGTTQVTVSNDGAATLTLQSCAPGCPAPAQVVLTSGSSTQLSVAKGGTTYYLVSTGGSLAGCLPLSAGERSPVPTSRAGGCPSQSHH
ncbi:MAG: hypothetical protein ACRDJU_11870 [Actinomycetota bacterium]